MNQPLRRIAMWSGPRNISTAMMRAWENRDDTVVLDEPFYAFYLNETHAEHPGSAEIIGRGEKNWRKVVAQLTSHVPSVHAGERAIFYQKQMTHHLLPAVDRGWLGHVSSCFLIRDPAEVIVSYLQKNGAPSAMDLGFPQQLEIFETVCELTGGTPPVIDAADVLRNPARTLRLLCEALAIEFRHSMLSWPAGRRESDGIWAKYWYAEVERSTSFQPYRKRQAEVPAGLRAVEEECRAVYDQLRQNRIS